MSYVEICKKHGQYHGELCGECFEDLQTENARLRAALEECSKPPYKDSDLKSLISVINAIARAALENK